MFKSFKLMLLSAALLTAGAASAQIRFEAPMSMAAHQLWSNQSSEISCVLSYAFPEYGRADFVLLSGPHHQLSMEIFPLLSLGTASQMRAVATPPAWKYSSDEEELGRIKLYAGFNPFFGDTVSWRILGALSKGNQVMLPFTDTKRLQGETVVPILSPMGFSKPFQEFLTCQGKLLSYGYKDVQMVAVHFADGGTTLTSASQQALSEQINYIKLDKSVNKIVIRAFAFEKDNSDDNLHLAKERAAAVRRLFTEAGIDGSMITEDAVADRQIALKDLSAAEREHTARAVIQLSRDPYKVNRSLEITMPDVGVETE